MKRVIEAAAQPSTVVPATLRSAALAQARVAVEHESDVRLELRRPTTVFAHSLSQDLLLAIVLNPSRTDFWQTYSQRACPRQPRWQDPVN